MTDFLEPKFIGAVPWDGPCLSEEAFIARKDASTARQLARLTASSEYAEWVARKRSWRLKDILQAALLLASVVGVTALAVKPELWPASFSSSVREGDPVGTPKGDVSAEGSLSADGVLGGEGGSWKEGAESRIAGMADRLSEPKHKLEDGLKSGQKFIQDKILHGGSHGEVPALQARVTDLEKEVRNLEGSAWFDSHRMANLQSQKEKLQGVRAMYRTLLTGLSLILGSLWLRARRRLHLLQDAHALALEKAAEAEHKLESEEWNHNLLKDLHALQSEEKAALEQELVDLRQAHSQLLQAQSPVVAPPPGLHSSPFGAEAQQSGRVEVNGHSSDGEEDVPAHREGKLVVELFPERPPRRSTGSTGGYWPAGPRPTGGTSSKVPAINIKEKDRLAGSGTSTPRVLAENQGNSLSARTDRSSDVGVENRDADSVTMSARELRRLQRSVSEKEKHVQYMDSQNKSLEAQLEQVTASLSHYMEEKFDVSARMHHDSQDMDEMSILLAKRTDDLEFAETEFLALQQVARQAVQWLSEGREPPTDVLHAMRDSLAQSSQHFEDKVSSEA